MFRKFYISNRFPNTYFPKIVVGCPCLCAVAVSKYPFVIKVMSLVGLPTQEAFRPQWIVFVAKRDDINWTPGSGRICRSHFTLDCYEELGAKLAEFYPSISPSVFRFFSRVANLTRARLFRCRNQAWGKRGVTRWLGNELYSLTHSLLEILPKNVFWSY